MSGGGKGEIITEERYNELVKCYGESYYPLDKKDYIGIQDLIVLVLHIGHIKKYRV